MCVIGGVELASNASGGRPTVFRAQTELESGLNLATVAAAVRRAEEFGRDALSPAHLLAERHVCAFTKKKELR